MKKVMLPLLCAIALVSCKKEDEVCNCGTVMSDDVATYTVVIKNDCSGNQKEFILSSGDWMNAHPGENFCITNVDSW
jgi:hypothetical protein